LEFGHKRGVGNELPFSLEEILESRGENTGSAILA
jgi:hypothetical protein